MNVNLNKLQNITLSDLKLYPQNPSSDINDMLNDILVKMWDDITQKALTQPEVEECIKTFATAVITNLIDKNALADLNTLFVNTLKNYQDMHIDSVYNDQKLKNLKMPIPSAKCIYTAQDISDTAKAFDQSKADVDRQMLLATIGAFYNNANALYVLFDDETAFDNFKSIANMSLKNAGAQEIPDDFTISNKIYDGLFIRKNYTLSEDENEPNTECRILSSILLTTYSDIVLPSKLIEAILPSTIVFFNAKKLSRASSSEILATRHSLGQMQQMDRNRIMSFKQMASLQQINRDMTKSASMMNQLNNALAQSAVAKVTGKFKIEEIDMKRVKKKILKIEHKMKNRDVTKNPKYHFADTYQRQNRREPNNPDLPGLVQDIGYYPDIHLYVDTSGSISEKDYADSVAMLIDIAKKLNCDIYFNSFTTDISQETVVRCRDRSKAQIQNDISKIPKLSGGTTIDQVWNYINNSKKNRRQLSILISDFYVDVPRYIKHPGNLYYIPTKDTDVNYAEEFAKRLPDPWRVLF